MVADRYVGALVKEIRSDRIKIDTNGRNLSPHERNHRTGNALRAISETTSRNEAITSARLPRRYQIRAGRRDDDKRKTKGRRQPPGYIPGAL